MAKRRFELSSGTSNKFWEVTTSDATYTVAWGRIGTAGQSKTKKTATASKDVADLIADKLSKGYREVGKSAKASTAGGKASRTKTGTPRAAKSDRARLEAAFRALRKRGYIADGPLGDTPSDGWTDVYEQSGDEASPALFFTSETGRAFKSDTLARKLPLQWRGDAKLIVETLGEHGFRASIPGSESEAISIVAGPPTKWPTNAKIARLRPTASADEKKQQYARFAKALSALRKDGWKVTLKKGVHFWHEPPPAGTISIAAPALWELPGEVERIAKLDDKPTASIRCYVGGKRDRVLKVLASFGIETLVSPVGEKWVLSVVLKA